MLVQPRQLFLESLDQFGHPGLGHHGEVGAADFGHADLAAVFLSNKSKHNIKVEIYAYFMFCAAVSSSIHFYVDYHPFFFKTNI